MYTIVIIKGSFTQVQRLCFHAPGSCRYHGPPAAYLKNQITSWQMQELYRFSDPSRHLHPFRDRAIALDTNGLNSGLCSCPCTGKNSKCRKNLTSDPIIDFYSLQMATPYNICQSWAHKSTSMPVWVGPKVRLASIHVCFFLFFAIFNMRSLLYIHYSFGNGSEWKWT